MKTVWLALAIAGFVLPLTQFVPWSLEHGLNGQQFLAELLANRISRGFAADLLISAATVLILIRTEGRRMRVPHRWAIVLGMFTVGLSFALPLYLYLREDHR